MPENNNPPGKNNATASLVLGIIAVIFWFFGYSSILSIILGIVGLIQASKAKELGYDDAIRTAGSSSPSSASSAGPWPFWPAPPASAARGWWVCPISNPSIGMVRP